MIWKYLSYFVQILYEENKTLFWKGARQEKYKDTFRKLWECMDWKADIVLIQF